MARMKTARLGVGVLVLGAATCVLTVPTTLPAGAIGGTLSVSVGPVAFGQLASGVDHPGLVLGTLTITDTLADASPTAWLVQVAASNCTTPQTGVFAHLTPTSASVASTALSITPGPVSVVTAAGGANEVAPVSGSSATFGSVGGNGFSTPVTVSSGPAGAVTLDNNGVFTQTATLDVNLTGLLLPPGTFSCTLQYTITG